MVAEFGTNLFESRCTTQRGNAESRQSRLTRLGSLDPIYFNPLSYQYSAGTQCQVGKDTVTEVNYVGSHQIHQGRNRDIN